MSTQTKANQSKANQSNKVVFGNKDNEKEYPITQVAVDRGRYVLLHYKNHTYPDPNNTNKLVDSGDIDSSSKRIGVYTKATFDEYVRENEKEGKENTFNKMLGKYRILHDPTLEEAKQSSGEDISSLTNPQLKALLDGFELSEDDSAALKTANKAALISLVEKYKAATE